MEHLNFNDAIKNIKALYSPNNNSNSNKSDSEENKENEKEKVDFFSFKKNFKYFEENESKLNIEEKNDNNSKNEESILSSGNFCIKNINEDNIHISNFSTFKDSNKMSKLSPFDNYVYSSSVVDNMDFNHKKNNSEQNEVSPFILPLSSSNKYMNENKIIEFKNRNPLLNHKRNLITEKKIFQKKSCNKFIVLNNSIFQKELNLLIKKFGQMSLLNEKIIPIKEENKFNCKNNFNSFPYNNSYVSIRKAFSDISNIKKIERTENINNKKIKVKMPKNFEIYKRKINFISFQDLANKMKESPRPNLNNIDGCCCKRYKNGKIK